MELSAKIVGEISNVLTLPFGISEFLKPQDIEGLYPSPSAWTEAEKEHLTRIIIHRRCEIEGIYKGFNEAYKKSQVSPYKD